MSDDPEMKACPLAQCGGKAQLVYGAMGGCYVECTNCGLTTRLIQDDSDDAMNHDLALRLWNTRSNTKIDDEPGLCRSCGALTVNPQPDNTKIVELLREAREQVGTYGYSKQHGRRVRQSWAKELLTKIDAALGVEK